MNRGRALRRRYGRASARVRASDLSMAGSIIYGHPDGAGGLREWTPVDLDRTYDLPYRWAAVILRHRDEARALGSPGVRGALGTTGETAVKSYAKKIAVIRNSKNPEQVS